MSLQYTEVPVRKELKRHLQEYIILLICICFSSDTDVIFDAADIAGDLKDDEVSFCKIFSYVIDKIRKCLFNNNNTINKYKIKINAHRHLCII